LSRLWKLGYEVSLREIPTRVGDHTLKEHPAIISAVIFPYRTNPSLAGVMLSL
jgi:hypothetical protein